MPQIKANIIRSTFLPTRIKINYYDAASPGPWDLIKQILEKLGQNVKYQAIEATENRIHIVDPQELLLLLLYSMAQIGQ